MSSIAPQTPGLWPLSFGQERLHFLERLHPDSALYAVPYRLEIDGALDAGALERAFCALIERHEVLRTCFVEQGGRFYQKVLPALAFRLPCEDLSGSADQDERVESVAQAFTAAPYDLGQGPLIRGRLLRRGPGRHVLLLGLHHAVFDGWSSTVMARELDALYCAAVDARAPQLPDLPLQYADFAQWQRQRHADGDFDGDLAYWRRTLAGVPGLLNLPTDRPRPMVLRHSGHSLDFEMPGELSAGILTLARSLAVTPFVVLTATVNILLSRYSGQTDLSVGFPVAGRSHPDLDGLIGFFSNTLVLRTSLTPEQTFREVVESTRDAVLGAIEHAELPFDKLVETLAPTRSLAHHPVFQVCVTHQTAEDQWRLGDLTVIHRTCPPSASEFDLTFCFEQSVHGLGLRIEYSTELFDEGRMARMFRHFAQLCRSAVDSPDAVAEELPLVSAEERSWILASGRGMRPPLPTASLASQFEAQVARAPGRIAVSAGGVRLTYASLDAMANRLARFLRRRGIDAEARVGLITGHGPDMITGMLGIVKAGGTYVPLDPAYPPERLSFMVRDSGVALVIGDALHIRRLRGVIDASLLIEIEAVAAVRDGEDWLGPPRRLERNDMLAYVMYTSGSTGGPKGVAIDHKAVTRLIQGNQYLPLSEGLTFAQISSCSFDPSTLETWGPLLHGGTVVLLDDLLPLEPERLAARLADEKVTSTIITVALLGQLTSADPSVFSTLNHVLFGGDRADARTLRRLRKGGFNGELINGYGPTEATTLACTHLVSAAEVAGSAIPIGRPIANTDVFILTPSMQLSPVGVVGELYIGGCGLARGYLGRPALTAERFVPDPFADSPGERLYRTGDLCFWNSDGTIGFVGRADDQVKVDGFRIELEEVRTAIQAHPQVIQAAIHAEVRSDGGKRLVAYIVPGTGDSRPEAEELKRFLRSRLPDYMVPGQLTLVDAFPLTSNGKIDFATLQARRLHRPSDTPLNPAPRSDLARRFLSVTARVLGLGAVHEHDRFFDIGGTSLNALRLTIACASELGRQLSLSAVLQSENMAALVRAVEELPRAGMTSPLRRSATDGHRELWPLSFGQERLHFLERLHPDSALYAVPYRLEIDGALDAGALERAFCALIERHEVLRTCFVEQGGRFYQKVLPALAFRLPCEDLSGSADQDERVESVAQAFTAAPYDLGQGPLIRGRLLRRGPGRHVLLLGLHHAVFDGWSSTVMARELDALYCAAVDARAPQLPDLPLQYADFAQWQRQRHADGDFDGDLAYWRRTLAGVPGLLNLPTDRPRPMVPRHSGHSLDFELPGELSAGILTLARSLAVTPFVVLTAAVNILLSRYSGQTDLSVGFPVAGRSHPDLDGLIGFFSNTLVLRTSLTPEQTFREVVESTRDAVLGAIEHAELPFDKLVETLAPTRSLAHHPVFQVCITHQTAEDQWRLGDLTAVHRTCPARVSKFDLTFTIEERGDGIRVLVEYSDELFFEGTVREMMRHLLQTMAVYAADPDAAAVVPVRSQITAGHPRSLRKPR